MSTDIDRALEGRVLEHLDYWDATLALEGIPVLGRIVKSVRRRLG